MDILKNIKINECTTDNEAIDVKIAKLLNLHPHPEGGCFKETYRSPLIINERNCSTAIYYLLGKNSVAKFHIIKSDEIWHFYAGSAIRLVYFDNNGDLQEVIMGNNILNREIPQYIISADTHFAAYPCAGTEYALLGCTVAPGFDYRDWKLSAEEELLSKYPNHREIIEKLT
ncbi:MAG: cupin domain-containing protein [Oligoflexia bacterium]|nr:cupin domain-containing protein [Oligoflexia bacterium]